VHGAANTCAIADIAMNKLQITGPRWVFPNVKHLDLLAARKQAAGNEIAKKP